jgi:hypothetical protein
MPRSSIEMEFLLDLFGINFIFSKLFLFVPCKVHKMNAYWGGHVCSFFRSSKTTERISFKFRIGDIH